ncbi:helix-turn-helix domain-containing protein [Cohnella silvisoli]|uniref:AraC family transcriptional regulator n=1 Tax=Cohnella silvisoli TaxID=2873699 RepID=A0ABV1KXF1_9BACL|nr:AraC family transcriptional regulator [Cohnella silvisoli]MCD9023731.1 AraC family transcriptional regulator [Cohnella silvisoli]
MFTRLSVREQLDFSLYRVERAIYDSFHLDMIKPYWTVSFVLDGEVKTKSQGAVEIAKSGDVMIYPPHVPFSETALGKGVHLWMLIDMRVVPQLNFFQRFPIARVVTLQNAQAYARTFDDLLNVWEQDHSPFRDFKAISLTVQLLEAILESWLAAGSPGIPASKLTEEDRFLQVVQYMEQNLDDKITRAQLAQILHLHPGYFNRAFKKMYGVSSLQMLKTLRLRKAAQMLEEPDNTLEVISKECGFGDAAYFSKIFKQSFGKTPGEYRRSIRNTKVGFMSS